MPRTNLIATMLALACGVLLASTAFAGRSGTPMPPQFPSPPPPTDFAPDIVQGSNALAIDLWQRVDQRPGNLAVSPASISIALTMAWRGADGATAAQFGKVLHIASDADRAGRDWGRLIPALESPTRRTTLRFADRIYAQEGFAFDRAFLSWTKRTFGAGMEMLDFVKSTERSRTRINTWIAARTGNHIADLLPAGTISRYTRMVLVDAVYFMGAWVSEFDAEATAPAAFFIAPTTSHDVQTMHLTAGLRAAQVEGAKVLELGYKDGYTDMLFVLPDRIDGLADLERNLTAASIDDWTKALEWKPTVIVSLPRFRIDPSMPLDLATELSALGLGDAFDQDKADFSGIARPHNPKDRLYIDEVVHRAVVTVDEKGAEAEAATVAIINYPMSAPAPGKTPPPPPPFVFKADHPFLFAIRDRSSGLILFLGRVADPAVR